MHDGADVVGHPQWEGVDLGELALVVPQVVPDDTDGVVPVEPLLLVPQAQRVANLMDRDAKLKQARPSR